MNANKKDSIVAKPLVKHSYTLLVRQYELHEGYVTVEASSPEAAVNLIEDAGMYDPAVLLFDSITVTAKVVEVDGDEIEDPDGDSLPPFPQKE